MNIGCCGMVSGDHLFAQNDRMYHGDCGPNRAAAHGKAGTECSGSLEVDRATGGKPPNGGGGSTSLREECLVDTGVAT